MVCEREMLEWMETVNAELIDRVAPNLTMAGEAVYMLDSTGQTPVVVGDVAVGGWPKGQDDEGFACMGSGDGLK